MRAPRPEVCAWVAVMMIACSSPIAQPPSPVPAHLSAPSVAPPRWIYMEPTGVLFDDAGEGVPVARPEPAILGGVRMLLEAGFVVGSAQDPHPLDGLRSIPTRLGGGFVVWSEDRSYLARDPLGDLTLIRGAPAGATGGARPWFSTLLLRTPAGFFELDPRAPDKPAHAAMLPPGTVEALALDARRAVRLDAVGRGVFTVDGGASWTDLLATRGVLVRAIHIATPPAPPPDAAPKPSGPWIVIQLEGDHYLALASTGDVFPIDADPAEQPANPLGLAAASPARQPSSQSLASETLGQVITSGVSISGERAVLARDGGARVVALRTGLLISDADLPMIAAPRCAPGAPCADGELRVARCQAVGTGGSAIALACQADTGAVVVAFDGSLTRLGLEATFPTAGAAFVGGPDGRLAYQGRCGPDTPSSADIAPPAEHPDAEDAGAAGDAGDATGEDDQRVCVRAASAHWLERRLRGDDARHLYRWVPGEGADVTAIVLRRDAVGAASVGEGVRVVRVDPEDHALLGLELPSVLTPQTEPPHASVDVDFWQDETRSIRGWVRLPSAEGEPGDAPAMAISPTRGGRMAGLRIDADGHVTVLPLPDGVTEVVTGGRFAVAYGTAPASASPDGGVGTNEESPRWYETTDGGASWSPIEAPPSGKLESPAEAATIFACSAMGCAWPGMVRLGWGPSANVGPSTGTARPIDVATASPRPGLTCRMGARTQSQLPAAAGAPPEALTLNGRSRGVIIDHVWSAILFAPLAPTPARAISARDASLESSDGAMVPVLPLDARAPLDALFVFKQRRLRAGRGVASFVQSNGGPGAVAADLPGDRLITLATDGSGAWITRGDVTADVLKLTHVGDITRTQLTLARRVGSSSGGLAVAAYSTSSAELAAGDLDLGRAEVAPLTRLGRLDRLAETGACPAATHRLLVSLPMQVSVGEDKPQDIEAVALVDADSDHVCVEAIEAQVSVHGTVSLLRATLGKGGAASIVGPIAPVKMGDTPIPPADASKRGARVATEAKGVCALGKL